MAAARVPLLCFEKEKLIREFARSVSDYHRLQSSQVAAVISGENFPLEDEIAQAGATRERAKLAVIAHQLKHGC